VTSLSSYLYEDYDHIMFMIYLNYLHVLCSTHVYPCHVQEILRKC